MRRLASIAPAALLLALPAGIAEAGWERAQWNMTPEQVAEAMGGQAPLRRGGRLGDKVVRNVGQHSIGRARFRTEYYYDAQGLALVTLDRRSGDCREIAQSIVDQHGQPLRTSDQVILRLFIWHDRPQSNRIRLMVSHGLCNLHYERLSDYEAHDLAEARRGA
jgi:hypothetical protein